MYHHLKRSPRIASLQQHKSPPNSPRPTNDYGRRREANNSGMRSSGSPEKQKDVPNSFLTEAGRGGDAVYHPPDKGTTYRRGKGGGK